MPCLSGFYFCVLHKCTCDIAQADRGCVRSCTAVTETLRCKDVVKIISWCKSINFTSFASKNNNKVTVRIFASHLGWSILTRIMCPFSSDVGRSYWTHTYFTDSIAVNMHKYPIWKNYKSKINLKSTLSVSASENQATFLPSRYSTLSRVMLAKQRCV